MSGREVWSARVRGDGGMFERATIEVDERGDFVLVTESQRFASYDRAVIERDDVVRLLEVLEEETAAGGPRP